MTGHDTADRVAKARKVLEAAGATHIAVHDGLTAPADTRAATA